MVSYGIFPSSYLDFSISRSFWHSGFIAWKARDENVWNIRLSPWFCRISSLILLFLFCVMFISWKYGISYDSPISLWFVSIGFVIIGGLIAFLGMGQLGKSSGNLVTNGLFRYSRHPIYAGTIILLIGCAGFSSNSLGWVGFGGLATYTFVGAFLEDRRLLRTLDGYQEFAQTRGFLFPWQRSHFRRLEKEGLKTLRISKK